MKLEYLTKFFLLIKEKYTKPKVKKRRYWENNGRYKIYYLNGQSYKDGGPTIYRIYNKDNMIDEEDYRLDGKLHREDGPAQTFYFKNGQIIHEFYYLNGKHHREDGPAEIRYINGKIERKYYYLNDEKITDEFQILVIDGLGMKLYESRNQKNIL